MWSQSSQQEKLEQRAEIQRRLENEKCWQMLSQRKNRQWMFFDPEK
jgi:hypothetical protein